MMGRSLEAFAKTYQRRHGGTPCWTCSLPEAAEINKALRGGVQIGAILSWLLDEKGIKEATRNRLHHHFSNRHHEAA